MRGSDIAQRRTATFGRQGFWDGVARRQVFRLLERLQYGRLVIHEADGETLEFGQAMADAAVIAHWYVEHPSVYGRVALDGSVGAGETYMAGHWHSPDLVKLVRLFALNLALINAFERVSPALSGLARRVGHGLRRNTRRRARDNIRAHYDLSNDFFALFLDPSMMYSAAIYPGEQATLEEAAVYKIRHICERLHLQPGDHLLEIGTGWGALAVYAAQHYGCRVTTTTLSAEQYRLACARVAAAGLGDRVEVLQRDYRELAGSYDKLVSVEMIEAVGHQYYAEYFRRCSDLLKPDGLMLIQAITIPDQRYQQALGSVDFIQKYIFPGGCLPSLAVIAGHVASDTDLQIVGLEDITGHYARTLQHWRERFLQREEQVRALGFDDAFVRMWEFYLAYCEGGFLERSIGTAQILMAKPRRCQLPAVAH